MHTQTHTSSNSCVPVHVCICAFKGTHACVHTYLHTHTCMHTHKQAHTSTNSCVGVPVHVCVSACAACSHLCSHTCMHTHTHTLKRSACSFSFWMKYNLHKLHKTATLIKTQIKRLCVCVRAPMYACACARVCVCARG